jgi:DNA-binding MarR family transcriptional regulator
MTASPDNEGTGAAIETDIPAKPGEISLGILDQYIGFHLRLAQNASFKAFKRHTGEHELKPGWFAVLMLIHVNPGITPMALSRASGRDKSTLTPVLRDLEQRRFVERCPVPNDKRSFALALTPSGEEMLAKLAAHAEAHDRKIDEIVGCENKAGLLRLLRRIAMLLD